MDEQIAVLLLEDRLEAMALESHARSLLAIPRVIALEPGRAGGPPFLRANAVRRQAARIWVPGRLRVIVLYHPGQYPLARALAASHTDAELWYLHRDDLELDDALQTHDVAARARAAGRMTLDRAEVDDQDLRERLAELGVISPRAFVPDARFRSSWALRRGR